MPEDLEDSDMYFIKNIFDYELMRQTPDKEFGGFS